jgi:hypothetical protein
VNGDGFSDVIAGAYLSDNGQTDEGRTYIYYGNEVDGLDRIPRQARTGDSSPIQVLGASNSPAAFRLKAFGRTSAGRGRVRLQWEVKPLGIPFDGGGLATGSWFDTGAPVAGVGSAVPLSHLASGLSPETLYHWRLRIVSDSPFFPHSPWLWLSGNAITESDVRTTATTAVSEGAASPELHQLLEAATPNPFGRETQIAFTLPRGGRHRLAIYDVAGRKVALVADGLRPAGRHSIRWNGRDERGRLLPAGTYFVHLEVDGRTESQKVTLVR